jgi:hypothetical protein
VHSEICAVPDERLQIDASILDAHYDGPRPQPSRGPRPKTEAEQQFCVLGEDAEAFLVGAAAIGNTRLGSDLDILLALGAAHGEQALVEALRRAVAFRRGRIQLFVATPR